MLTIRIKTRAGRNTIAHSAPYTPENLRTMAEIFMGYVVESPKRYMLVVWWEDQPQQDEVSA